MNQELEEGSAPNNLRRQDVNGLHHRGVENGSQRVSRIEYMYGTRIYALKPKRGESRRRVSHF